MTTRKTTKPAKVNAPSKAQPLTTQPQSKSAAAQQAGMTLATNDKWSQAYWDPNDLHSKERELFG